MDKISEMEIIEISKDEVELRFDGISRGLVKLTKSGVKFYWYTAGLSSFQEAKVWLQGMLDLMIVGEAMVERYEKTQK